MFMIKILLDHWDWGILIAAVGYVIKLKYNIYKLKEELDLLNSAIIKEDTLVWKTHPREGEKAGPYCPTCWANNKVLQPLQMEICYCHKCNFAFKPEPIDTAPKSNNRDSHWMSDLR
jgi:hypothetical protein